MLAPVILLSIACGVHGSGIHHALPAGVPPVVAASSSQYFERTFNRLISAQPLEPVIPVAPPPPVLIDTTRTTVIPINPTEPPQQPSNPNIAIAIATAHAAAPVATFLLPPYPFGLPPSFGLIPQGSSETNFNTVSTQQTTTEKTTTERDLEATTPVPSNVDNSFAQTLPSDENLNFKQYGLPLPLPRQKPQKIKTSVEVVAVPLAYIAPPPLDLHHHHHHGHHHGHYEALRIVPHVHTFIPKTAKIIIRPIRTPIRVGTTRIPVKYSRMSKKVYKRDPQRIRSNLRDIEPTTINPINRPSTKPPK